jgi:urease subunit beta
MFPGRMSSKDDEVEISAGRRTVALSVTNTGDRSIQVTSTTMQHAVYAEAAFLAK